ncbi:bifunctional lytic transglycosylase/C40 family peptidase [Streptacidiphilus sp. N1-10]|uniref:Bifunctional lytic transglycosylase/C40 family peptidase n=1 Tax=Streptacidiphilus jeojiensis TaxID=3229225 RepID=A0ABV6XIB0_9ACTN
MSDSAARAATGIAAGCAGTLLLLVAAITAVITLAVGALTGGLSLLGGAPPSSAALADIPPAMLTLYQQAAATCPGLPWNILAGIGKVESDHGRAKNQVSSAGALGPMQFLPATFAQYARPVPSGGAVPATPWDPVDAVFAAARLLCAAGAKDGRDIPRSILAYNHSSAYQAEVLAYARQYADAVPTTSGAAAKAIAYAQGQLGVPYAWGAQSPGVAWDCSALVQSAYASADIRLPRTAQAQYDTGPLLPPSAPVLPGDLIFYGSGPNDVVHVAIAVSPTMMINAPRPGEGVKYDPVVTGQPIVGHTRPASSLAG